RLFKSCHTERSLDLSVLSVSSQPANSGEMPLQIDAIRRIRRSSPSSRSIHTASKPSPSRLGLRVSYGHRSDNLILPPSKYIYPFLSLNLRFAQALAARPAGLLSGATLPSPTHRTAFHSLFTRLIALHDDLALHSRATKAAPPPPSTFKLVREIRA